jgi:hypothetical protein
LIRNSQCQEYTWVIQSLFPMKQRICICHGRPSNTSATRRA